MRKKEKEEEESRERGGEGENPYLIMSKRENGQKERKKSASPIGGKKKGGLGESIHPILSRKLSEERTLFNRCERKERDSNRDVSGDQRKGK